MTTTRTRRTPSERAADILRKELVRREAKVAQLADAFYKAELLRDTLRQTIAMLDQLPLPGLDVAKELATEDRLDVKTVYVVTKPMKDWDIGDDLSSPPNTAGGLEAMQPVAQTPMWDGKLPSFTKRFVPTPLVPSACPHPQTGMVDGVRRCLNPSCNRPVYSSVDTTAGMKP